MKQSIATTARPSSIWIISPTSDLLLFLATPLAIVPALLLLVRYQYSPEQVALAVFAFASLGHHLPGFLRAYGERDLIRRFRWRFILAPPLFLTVSWMSFVWLRFHGLELLLLFWATWHILMQTYGFMRIYDRKLHRTNVWDARIDFWSCLAVFAAGIVLSDTRVFGIVETLWLIGFPVFGAEWLTAARWLVGGTTVLILMLWLLRAGYRWREGVCWLKLLLLLSTAALYWSTGQVSVNLLVGVAIFEVFHAIQYYAIAWFYNQQRSARSQNGSDHFGFLLSGSRLSLLIYCLAILAFGSLGYLGRSSDVVAATRWAMALFSASAMLHFYYDGFIWKVREQETSQNLNIGNSTDVKLPKGARRQVLAWGTAAALLAFLIYLEARQPPPSLERERQHFAALAELTPDQPELQLRQSQLSLLSGDSQAAFDLAQQAVALRPRSYDTQLALGDASTQLAQWSTARQAYQAASALRPRSTAALLGLGTACVQISEFAMAGESLEGCLRLEPNNLQAQFQLGNVHYFNGETDNAIRCYRRCNQLQPDFADAYTNLGSALLATSELTAAADAYRTTIQLQPSNAAAHYNLGLVLLNQGKHTQARGMMIRASELGQPVSREVAEALQL